ncbi:hypothetical protein ACFLSJ_06675 [Verrucomicrobiota bacterium]
MPGKRVKESEQLRNTTTVRWSDDQMRIVSDTAWRRRTTVSEMIRGLVMDALGKEGGKA